MAIQTNESASKAGWRALEAETAVVAQDSSHRSASGQVRACGCVETSHTGQISRHVAEGAKADSSLSILSVLSRSDGTGNFIRRDRGIAGRYRLLTSLEIPY